MVTDADKRILMVNRAFTEITGYSEADSLGRTPGILRSGRHDDNYYTTMWGSLKARGHWQGEIWNRRKNGEIYPELLSISEVRNEAGDVTNYVGVFADITQIKDSESKLQFLAHHDPLTRLPNRLLLQSRLEHGIEMARREGKLLALLMLDLDRFKDVNDRFGHLVGDEMLQQVAESLTARLRGADTVSRMGGDEFTVMLEDIARPEDAGRVANDIIAILSQPWHMSNGIEAHIGASVGISLFPEHGDKPEALLQHADAALYQAKNEGRGCFKYFSDVTRAARDRIGLETRLRRAIEQSELRLYFQPQFEIPGDRLVGVEALVRWQNPEEGLILPDRFLRLAEETGLITLIDDWVLKESCRQGKLWVDIGIPPLVLAVNLSAYQFQHGKVEHQVASVLAETGFPAASLELELTEQIVTDSGNDCLSTINGLRAQGVRLAIDDFGTGHSSLNCLKRFQVDTLKIDRSFVDGIPSDYNKMEIAATIIAVGHAMRMKVLAEGVESAEQLYFLREQGCDAYQGYLKCPPLPADEFETFLRRG
ncbi:MAG: diguanylate cyclase [Proteobacteria bacterium]|nr:diguanylate cyclase [Pseudomonadota bacterium]